MRGRILVADADPVHVGFAERCLTDVGLQTIVAATRTDLFHRFARAQPHIVLITEAFDGVPAASLLERMLSEPAFGHVQTFVSAAREDAEIVRPYQAEPLVATVRAALGDSNAIAGVGDALSCQRTLEYLVFQSLRQKSELGAVLLSARTVKAVRQTVRRVDYVFRADADTYVLLLPETDAAGVNVVASRSGPRVIATSFENPQQVAVDVRSWLDA